MLKQLLLIFNIVFMFIPLFAQVEYNTTGALGIVYKINERGPVIDKVMPGSPADMAGLQRSNRLIKINDQPLEGLTMEQLAEKLKTSPGQTIKIRTEDYDKTQQEVVLKRAAFFSATYNANNYIIFFDDKATPLSKPNEPCVWGAGCYNGIGYYVYSPTEAFYGVFENGHRKEGLYYYANEGKPYYYLGSFSNNQYTGKGTLTYPNSINERFTYTGDFANDKANGTGEIKNRSGKIIYTGGIKDWDYDGFGKLTADDGTVQEGQWKAGVFQDAKKPVADPYAGLNVYQRGEAMLVAEKKADSIYRATLYAQANAAVGRQTSSGALSGTALLDRATQLFIKQSDTSKYKLYEAYDVEFSKSKKAICSVGCKENYRFIDVLVEENIPGFSLTKLVKNETSGTPGNVIAPDKPKEYDKWEKQFSVKGITLYCYYNAHKTSNTCSYKWEILSDDEQTHKAKVLVFDFKK